VHRPARGGGDGDCGGDVDWTCFGAGPGVRMGGVGRKRLGVGFHARGRASFALPPHPRRIWRRKEGKGDGDLISTLVMMTCARRRRARLRGSANADADASTSMTDRAKEPGKLFRNRISSPTPASHAGAARKRHTPRRQMRTPAILPARQTFRFPLLSVAPFFFARERFLDG